MQLDGQVASDLAGTHEVQTLVIGERFTGPEGLHVDAHPDESGLVTTALRTVIVCGLRGTALAGVLAYTTATSVTCEVFSEDLGATWYRVFGRYLSETTYHAFIEPLKGLVIGLGLGFSS